MPRAAVARKWPGTAQRGPGSAARGQRAGTPPSRTEAPVPTERDEQPRCSMAHWRTVVPHDLGLRTSVPMRTSPWDPYGSKSSALTGEAVGGWPRGVPHPHGERQPHHGASRCDGTVRTRPGAPRGDGRRGRRRGALPSPGPCTQAGRAGRHHGPGPAPTIGSPASRRAAHDGGRCSTTPDADASGRAAGSGTRAPSRPGWLGSCGGGRDRTDVLRRMRPTSYRCSTPTTTEPVPLRRCTGPKTERHPTPHGHGAQRFGTPSQVIDGRGRVWGLSFIDDAAVDGGRAESSRARAGPPRRAPRARARRR